MPRKSTGKIPAEQIALFNQGDTFEAPNAFRKPVQVIHSMPRTHLSLVQRKLANAWLKNATDSLADKDGMWTINTARLAEDIGFDSNNRAYLVDAARALMSVIFEWDVISPEVKRNQVWKASVLFPEVEIRPDMIRYQISRQVLEQVLSPEMYALIDLNVLKRFRRASSLALYEHCLRFERIKRTTEVEWNLFRDIILGDGSDAKSYKEYKVFKDKVLKLAIAEINALSDITVELQETKIGRRVHALWFTVTKVQPNQVEPIDDAAGQHLVAEMVALGLMQSEARQLVGKCTQAEISGALSYTNIRMKDQKSAKLANPAAYFRRALSGRWAATETATAPGRVNSKKQDAGPDIAALYRVEQIKEASRYFEELNPEDQKLLVEEYNQMDIAPSLKIKGSKPGKAVQTRFYGWLALRTWGEPKPEELLRFAQQILASSRS